MIKEKTPLVSQMFTADPSAHVFNDRIYIYPSHDIPHDGADNDEGDEYMMTDYHVFSMDESSHEVTDHGEALHMKDVPWVLKQMWAPDCVFKNGKYYLVFPARDKDGIFRLGIAISETPVGPFSPEPDYIKGSFSIDPCSFIDDDGKVYIYFGGLWGGQLEKYTAENANNIPKDLNGVSGLASGYVFNPEGTEPSADSPAVCPKCALMNDDMLSFAKSPCDIVIVDENGHPIKAGDENRRYFEDPWMHKYNGKYYFSYSTGTTHYIVYAVSDTPYGPFTYKGRILEPVLGWTTHHSIVQYHEEWYLFYHDCELSKGINHRRNVKYCKLSYNDDGTIKTITP